LTRLQTIYPQAATTTDFADILNRDDVQAVVVATPARTHYGLARAALEANKHVLVEKPLAMSSAEAEALIDLAEERQRVLMVGHIFEYHPAVRKIRSLIDEGHLGQIYYIYSTRVNLGRVQSDINALWSIAPHDVSILLYLLGAMPESASAHGGTFINGTVEDVVFLVLGFPEGVLGHVHASWLDPSKVRRMTIVGSRRMVIYDDVAGEGKIKIYDKGVYRKGDDIYGEFQYRVHSGDIAIPKLEMTEPLRIECTHFAECIQQGRHPLTDGRNGLRVVRVLEAAQTSLGRGGTTVSLPQNQGGA
jgi:predicted dehydrogenase